MEVILENNLLQITPDVIENVRKIYDLDKPGRLKEAINILEEWIQKQDHIIKKDFSKKYLERMLTTCKGSVEKAKKQIDRLCTMKTLLPKFFLKSNLMTELQNITEIASMIPLPKLTKDFYRVILIKIQNKYFTAESLLQYYQYTVIVCEYLTAHDYANGFIIIDDFSELNILEVMSKMNLSDFQQYITILTEGFGARMKSSNLLTDSKAVELLLKTCKQLLSEKISSRFHVRRTIEELYKVVPKEILPVEYGGNERSIHKLREEWLDELSSEKHVEYMKMMSKACTDETKRHAGKFNEDYMGMPGSFRSLSVD